MAIDTTTCSERWLHALCVTVQAVRMRALAVAVLVAAGLSACDEPSPPARAQAPDTPERMVTFTLGGTSFAMPLPEQVKVEPSSVRDEISFDLSRGRSLRWLELATGPNRWAELEKARTGSDVIYDRSLPLENGGRLEFHISDDTSGGSGGPSAVLLGRIQIRNIALSLRCGDQDKVSVLRPDWCLPYLRRMTIVERGQ